jgi:hypothetical protein
MEQVNTFLQLVPFLSSIPSLVIVLKLTLSLLGVDLPDKLSLSKKSEVMHLLFRVYLYKKDTQKSQIDDT